MLEEGLAVLFVAALFALDAFLLEAQAKKIAVVLVFEGATRGLERLGRDEFFIREVGKVGSDTVAVLQGKKREKETLKIIAAGNFSDKKGICVQSDLRF